MIHDISPLLDERIAVWPGDTAYAATVHLRLEDGDPVALSDVRFSCHTGAHADAPSHYVSGAPTIDAMPLDAYLGPCTVHDVAGHGPVTLDDLRPRDLEPGERVLLRLLSDPDRTRFAAEFRPLTVELVDDLARRGVRLIGLDAPSVDAFDSRDLPVHHALHRRRVANLESLELAGVPVGRYELIALPLRLSGRDASPVRAVLRDLGADP